MNARDVTAKHRYRTSLDMHRRAEMSLAGGVSSEFRKFGYPHPMFYASALGSRITDVDGNSYLDFSLSQGPLVLGHGCPEVLAAVTAASSRGQLYAGQYLEEIDLAETIQRLVPCAELVRFGLDGSTTVQAALRLARAVTGRSRYLRFEGHYHGWLDNVAMGISGLDEKTLGPRSSPRPSAWTEGLPTSALDEVLLVPWNDPGLLKDVLDRHGSKIAAIICEPVMCNNGCIPPAPGFLQYLRDSADRAGALLIFDEVITGFRLALGGAQSHYGVTPDLGIFAKAVANGYPLSVLAGKREYMQWIADGRVIHAGTLNAGVPSVAAAQATISAMENNGIHAELFRRGRRLMDGLRQAAAHSGMPLRVQGPGPMFHTGFTRRHDVTEYRHMFDFDARSGSAFARGMHDRGVRILTRGLWYISAAHTDEDVDVAVSTATDILTELAASGCNE